MVTVADPKAKLADIDSYRKQLQWLKSELRRREKGFRASPKQREVIRKLERIFIDTSTPALKCRVKTRLALLKIRLTQVRRQKEAQARGQANALYRQVGPKVSPRRVSSLLVRALPRWNSSGGTLSVRRGSGIPKIPPLRRGSNP